MALPPQRDPESARAALEKWLANKLDDPSAHLSPFTSPGTTGFSSETLISDDYVVKIEPSPEASVFLDHAFETQFRVMQALEKTDVMVPPALWFEPDPSILGRPFYVIARRPGRAPDDSPPYHLDGWVKDEASPQERERMWWSGLDQLAAIHRVDHRSLGLTTYPQNSLDEQLDYYTEMLDWAKKDWPGATLHERALGWLRANRPDAAVGLCWGDARIGNILFEHGEAQAVLDWEMVTLGDPQQDLAWYLFLDRHHSEGLNVERLAGFPSHESTITRWEELTGRRATDLGYYTIYAGFRFAVIMMRVIAIAKVTGLFPVDSDYGVNNIVTQLLAADLDKAEQ